MDKRTWTAVLLAAALCLAVAAPAAAANPVRPMSGWWLGTDSLGDVSTCPAGAVVRYQSEGSGRMLHLGRVTFTVTHCVFVTSPTTARFEGGVVISVAANGDTLAMHEHGTVVIGGATNTGELEWEVTGGSGRFADAGGSGTGVVHTDVPGGWTIVHFSGTVSY